MLIRAEEWGRQQFMMVRRLARGLLGLCLFLLCTSAFADGLDYLATQQNANGSFGNTATSLATPIQSTAEALRAYQVLGEQTRPLFALALSYLNADAETNTEFLSRKIVVNFQAGGNVAVLINTLIANQNGDGGFGDQPGYDSSVFDTAYALHALSTANYSAGTAVPAAVGYLLLRQTPSGGWADGENDVSVFTTVQVVRALSRYRTVYQGVAAALTNAQAFLLSQRTGSGSWGENFTTALALIALVPESSDLAPLNNSLANLQAAQIANGSWDNDAYTTALALQALWLATHRPPAGGLTAIQGRVIDSITGLALSGVAVNVTGPASRSVVTAPDGAFRFQDLPAGTYTLALALNGYGTLTTTTTAASTITLDLGTLALTKAGTTTTGTLYGHVTDASTGAPLSGALVSISGGPSASTNASGDYQIANVSPGSVTVSASKAGYASLSGTGTLAAGGVLVFSPALPPANAGTSIQGQVTDGANNQPLAGVAIRLNGAVSATTDAAGRYRIDNVTPGAITLSAELGGYDTATATGQVAANALATVSLKLYRSGTTPADSNTAGVTGVVLDAGTSTPIAGVTIQASFGATTQTITTATDGRFTVTGLTATSGTLTFSATDYVSYNLGVTLTPLTVLDIGQVRLRRANTADLLPDLIVQSIDTNQIVSNPHTLTVSGTLSVTIANIGTATAQGAPEVIAFYDVDGNKRYDAGVDLRLGQAQAAPNIGVTQARNVTMIVTGTLPFRDAPISVFVDSAQTIVESNEINNVATTASACEVRPTVGSFAPVLKWAWTGSDVLPQYNQVMSIPIVAPLQDTNGDGKIDQLDMPAVIFHTFAGANIFDGVLRAVSGRDGHELWTVTDVHTNGIGSIAVADIDGDGKVEIIVPKNGGGIMALDHQGKFLWQAPVNVAWGGAAIADLDGDGKAEIVVGNTVFNYDGTLRWKGSGFIGGGGGNVLSLVADINLDGKPEIIAGASAYDRDGNILWQNDVAGDGFAAIGNFNSDPYPEIVVTGNGTVSMVDHAGNLVWGPVAIPGGGWGGPPTIADVDGDGIPEIGIAGASRYTVFKADGSVLWSSPTQDFSSAETGSSVFDFDGDGQAEVVYNDERFLRVYRGKTGEVLFQIGNTSGTTLELPVVADVDNDGHADIVVCTNDYAFSGNGAGIRVYSDANNSWVNTRKIWNQHSYHITNVNDDGSIPRVEQNSWQVNNTYRLNAFADRRGTGTPDLTAGQLHFGADAGGARLTVRVGNAGAEISPADVVVRFYEGAPGTGRVLGDVVLGALAPGAFTDVTLNNITALAGNIDLYAVVDATNRVTECREDNNTISIPGRALVPDLVIRGVDVGQVVTDPQSLSTSGAVTVTVVDQGTLGVGPGVQVLVFYDVNNDGAYQAGTDIALGTGTLSALGVGANQAVTVPVSGSAPFRDAPIKAWIDSGGSVTESNELNNVAAAAGACRVAREPPAFMITTVAGNGVRGYSGDGGPALTASFNEIFDAVATPDGGFFVVDTRNFCIRKVDANGMTAKIAGICGVRGYNGDNIAAVDALINDPHGMGFDAAGNIYIADNDNSRIRKITNGIITTIGGLGFFGYSGDGGPAAAAAFNGPDGMTVDSSGNLLISDTGNNRIRKITTDGTVNTIAGTGAPGYNGDNQPATSAQISTPFDIATDQTGNIYFADYTNHRVRRISSSGVITTIAGNGVPGFSGDGGPATAAQLWFPAGLAIDQTGNVYIADSGNNRIRIVLSDGTIATVAGDGPAGFGGDGGSAKAARLNTPMGVSIDTKGRILIADSQNDRVRRLERVSEPTAFTFTTIDVPGSASTSLRGINDAGQIVGTFDANSSGFSGRGFIKSGSTFTPIDFPGATRGTHAQGINNAGDIVGVFMDSALVGFRFSGGTYTRIAFDGQTNSNAIGISNAGVVVGVRDVGPVNYGFIQDASNTTFFRVSNDQRVTEADGISPDGSSIVGHFGDDAANFGFLKRGDTFTTIAVPGASHTFAYGVNDVGQIVGNFISSSGVHGFLLENGAFTTLDVPNAVSTQPFGISNGGEIVGQFTDSQGKIHGFLARRSLATDLTASLLRVMDHGAGQGVRLSVRVGSISSSSGPANWWPLNETSGVIATDVIAGNNGTYSGAPTPISGKVGGALSFDGVNDKVVVSSLFPFHQPTEVQPTDITLYFWIRTSATGHQSIFWTRPDSTDANRFNIFVNSDSTFGLDYREPNGTLHILIGQCCTGFPIPRDAWTNLAISRTRNADGSDIYKLYVNGAFATSATDQFPVLPNAVGWQMSGRGGSAMFNGALDEVKIYSRALSSDEILAIYNGDSLLGPATEIAFYDGDPVAGGVLLGTTTVSGIPAGGFRDIVFNTTAVPSGTKDIYAVVDPNNRIAECREDNNTTHTAPTANVRGVIAVATDKAVYGASSAVVLQGLVTNTGALTANFTAELRVEDLNGATVQTFPTQTISALQGGLSLSIVNGWNTGSTIAGTYKVHGFLRDSAGGLLSEAVSSFEIRNSETGAPKVTLRTTTDRPLYNTVDLVNIQSLVVNTTTNALLDNLRLRLRVKDAVGTVLFTNESALGQLPPSALRDLLLPYNLNGSAVGTFRVEGEVIDAGGAVLASSSAPFTVAADAARSLIGQVSVANATVEIGASQLCSYAVTNRGTEAFSGISLRMTVVNATTGTAVDTANQSVNAAAGGTQTILRSVATANLVPGDYACALEALLNGTYKSLGFAAFKAVEPPIRIDASMAVGEKGRLLILLDTANQCDADDADDYDRHGYTEDRNHCPRDTDPHGPKDAPSLSVQRSFLENLLTQIGWTYTVTDTANAFARELRTGGYAAYALFSEQVKLDEQVQKELREAVFRGEGLIVAGSHDNRNSRLNDALGIKRIGTVAHVLNVVVNDNELGQGTFVLIPGDRINRVSRLTAQSLAVYQLSGPSKSSDYDCRDEDDDHYRDRDNSRYRNDDDCHKQPDTFIDAITLNTYGDGKALFAGFDLLAQAAKDGAASTAAATLGNALTLTHPKPLKARINGVVPIVLTLINQGNATVASATVTVPPGTSVVDAGTGVVQTVAGGQSITWTINLALREEKHLTFYVRLPLSEANVILNAKVAVNGRSIAQTVLTLSVHAVTSLEQLLAQANSLAGSLPAFRSALNAAASDLDKANRARKLDSAIAYVIEATDDLLGITDPQMKELRRQIDEWLRYVLVTTG